MKENTLFKLDLLEAFYLQKPPRFGVTKQMLRSEKYQSKKSSQSLSTRSEKQRHKLLQLGRDDAFKMIIKLQHEAFDKKLHFIETALLRAVKNALKKEKLKINQKLHSIKDDDGKLKDLNSQLNAINELLSINSKIIDDNIKHKIFKVIIQMYPSYIDLKNDKFIGIPQPSIDYIKSMKQNNPYKLNGELINNILSRLYSDKSVKSAIDNINTLEIIWGPKKYVKNNDDELQAYDNEGDEDNQSANSSIEEEEEEEEHSNSGDDEPDYEKLYDGYKDYIAGSSDEEDEDTYQLDPNINYNEVTDEETSDDEEEEEDTITSKKKRSIEDDDFFATAKKPKSSLKDIQLPTLATGYYSGGESDEEDTRKDDLVDEITKPRKNRRGQRARQKIWEKKYGSKAKHVVSQHERAKSDRERLRLEFEARQAKRDQKQKEREERDKLKAAKLEKEKEKNHTIHPSWEAKLKAQEALKKAKFQGKKITFD